MKAFLSSVVVLLAFTISTGAKELPSYPMDYVFRFSDVVVYCQENDVQGRIVKCKVLQAFKGDVLPDADLTVAYNDLLQRRSDEFSLNRFPPRKALLFLHKNKSGTYGVIDAKLVQLGGVFCFEQEMNPGVLILVLAKPENIKLEKGREYGEKELLEDFALAMKKWAARGESSFHGNPFGRPFE